MTEQMIPQLVVDDVDIAYPDTDGEPMAESDRQRDWMIFLIKALQLYYAHLHNVYVSGNLMMYYVEGDMHSSIAPDVFVVFGVAKEIRDTYLVWKEGKGPDVVIEITSRTTRKRDQVEKPIIYRDMGVREYFQYDPTGDYLFPALQGLRLAADGTYVPIAPRTHNGLLVLVSEVLGLELHLDKLLLRLYDPANQSYLLSYEEAQEARRRAEIRVRAEEEARRQAEARAEAAEARAAAAEARAQAEVDARRQAEARAQAEADARRCEEEARRQAEEQMKALEAEIRRLRQQGA